MTKWLILIFAVLLTQSLVAAAYAIAPGSEQVKELNLVFLHGATGTPYSTQLLSDAVEEQAVPYVSDYERANPGVKVRINMLKRGYPSDVGTETWANNIADALDKHFAGKRDLVLIGHSMGGKAALYLAAHNVKNQADRISAVVTINSPVKSLDKFYVTGAGPAAGYVQLAGLFSGRGVADSAAHYDSSADGAWVGANKRWLAFVSAESAPLSPQFDTGRLDAWPRDMDDGLIPIPAQYSDGADVVYYGERGHGDAFNLEPVARYIAARILRYIFGGEAAYSVLDRTGNFGHSAGGMPFRYSWEDLLDETLVSNGRIVHTNRSFWNLQTWQDTVGTCPPGGVRGKYSVQRVESFPLFTRVGSAAWLTDDPADCRLNVTSQALFRSTVQVDWRIFGHLPLPEGGQRDHYEITELDGTSQAGVPGASWAYEDKRDVRLRVVSDAEGPFRWFRAEWRTYHQEIRQRKLIDQIPAHAPDPTG